MEILSAALIVGTAVARSVLTSRFEDSAFASGLTGGIGDLARQRVGNLIEARRVSRLFDKAAEDVAVRLEPLIEIEASGIEGNELAAAVLAVETSLGRMDMRRALLDADFDYVNLAAAVRAEVGDADSRLLGERATGIYNLLLDSSCLYIIQVSLGLPSTLAAIGAELLARESDVLDRLGEIVDRLPDVTALQESDDPDARFESRYRVALAQKLDRLNLFGVTLTSAPQRYSLSVAYLSLEGRTRTAPGNPEGETPTSHDNAQHADTVDEESQDERTFTYERVETLLGASSRHFIRGEAGCGKTTLLQWLAVRSAKSDYPDELATWNETVPFFIQLRRWVGIPLPRPEQFLADTNRNLEGDMPQGWVHRVLDRGDALLLIDGVDELPEEERDAAHRWLVELTSDFPECRVVVTSRPPAVGDEWLDGGDFSVSELLPMETADIRTFIDQWHLAACEGVSAEDKEAMLGLATKLKQSVSFNSSLRLIASSPLLCAMLCTLHRDRGSKLPTDRLELYRVALEMLLLRRDQEREVSLGIYGDLELPQKLVILQDFALWLIENGRSDADVSDFKASIERRRHGLRISHAFASDDIYRALLVRSGLLREPTHDRIDFIHRTFQEYLAAKEIVDKNSIPFLISMAHHDQWREVVVLAAGHARPDEARELIEGLIERGNDESSIRHVMHFLAIACLETVRDIEPTVAASVRALLAGLLPPRNMSQAKALASAGDLAAPLLGAYQNEYASTVAACVRSLCMIGTEEALQALESYRSDGRVTVTRELLRGWGSFDEDEYVDRVLAYCSFERGALYVQDPEILAFVTRLTKVRRLYVVVPRGTESLDSYRPVAGMISRFASVAGRFADLDPLVGAKMMTSISLTFNRELRNIDGLAGCSPWLHSVSIAGCPHLESVAGLAGLEISRLSLSDLDNLFELSPLQSVRGCREMTLSNLRVSDLSFVPEGDDLSVLVVMNTDIVVIDELDDRTIGFLDLDGSRQLRDISAISRLRSLRQLDLSRCSEVDLTPLADHPELRKIAANDNYWLTDLSVLATIRNLQSLQLRGGGLSDVSPLEGLRRLNTLDLSGCENLTDVSPLSSLRSLRHLQLGAETPIGDWSPLLDMPRLRRVSVSRDCPSEIQTELRERDVQVTYR